MEEDCIRLHLCGSSSVKLADCIILLLCSSSSVKLAELLNYMKGLDLHPSSSDDRDTSGPWDDPECYSPI